MDISLIRTKKVCDNCFKIFLKRFRVKKIHRHKTKLFTLTLVACIFNTQ